MKPGKKRWAHLQYRSKIQNILLLYYVTPILLILIASGGFFYYSAKRILDAELGRRLVSIAMSASSHVRGFHVSALELKDRSNLTYQTLAKRFEKIRKDNQIEKIYLFNSINESCSIPKHRFL